MNIITDPSFYILAIPVVLMYGMAKGGLGPAVGAISIPILSFVINPVQAAAIMLPILCVMDIFAVWKFRNHFSSYHLSILLPAGITGIVIASFLMGHLHPDAIKFIIGITVILFCFNYWFRSDAGRQADILISLRKEAFC